MTMSSLSDESSHLGQFIPLHYHYNLLNDAPRIESFKKAIELGVPEGSVVVELGSGTGVLAFFAARKAKKVYCVEKNPDLVKESKRLFEINGVSDKVVVVEADAQDYVPPEPVDVVVCEMLHVGLMREKQGLVLNAFKKHHIEKHGCPPKQFLPEASIHAVQPVQQSFDFAGFRAPVILFQHPQFLNESTTGLAEPQPFKILQYADDFGLDMSWERKFRVTESGELNALRLTSKNILHIDVQTQGMVEWFNQYMVVPLAKPFRVESGDFIRVSFKYEMGDEIDAFSASVEVAPAAG